MPTLRYLAYGSNLHPVRLRDRVGEITVRGTVALPGWRLVFSKRGSDGSGKCALVRDGGAQAWAVVYDMPADARETLDRIEGLGKGYRSAWLSTATLGACYTYLPREGYVTDHLLPYDWYHALVVSGATHHGLPADYVAGLHQIARHADPDPARAAQNLAALDAPP